MLGIFCTFCLSQWLNSTDFSFWFWLPIDMLIFRSRSSSGAPRISYRKIAPGRSEKKFKVQFRAGWFMGKFRGKKLRKVGLKYDLGFGNLTFIEKGYEFSICNTESEFVTIYMH